MLTLSLTGCSSTTSAPSVDSESPWGITTGTYEKSTYTVEINEYNYADGEYTVGDNLANGTYVQEIENVFIDSVKTASASSQLEVNWIDDAAALTNQNKTDTMTSTSQFTMSGNTPISSTKTAEIADRVTADGEKMDNYSYAYSTDYDAKTATINFGKDSADSESYQDTKTVDISSSVNFDNEQLFYTLRAFNGYTLGSYLTFNLFNAVDAYQYGDDHYHEMAASYDEDYETVTLGDFILSHHDSTEIDCMVVTVQITGYDMGSVHTFYITDPDITFSTGSEVLVTSKLITKYEYTSLSYDGEENYIYTYTLSDYATLK